MSAAEVEVETGVRTGRESQVFSTPLELEELIPPESIARSSYFPSIDQIPERFSLNRSYEQKCYLIDGELREWSGPSERVLSILSSTNVDGQLKRVDIGSYPKLSAEEAIAAVEAATKAYSYGMGEWPAMQSEERIACVEKFVEKMIEKRDEIIKLTMWEIGKNLSDATSEFDRTVEYIELTVSALRQQKLENSEAVFSGETCALIRRAPIGVALCMAPFNYPLNDTLSQLIPILLMGNTVVLKPAKFGVLLMEPLLEAFKDSFPKGVVNTVYGDGKEVITPIVESGKIDLFSFIGSTKVAEIIMRNHPHKNRVRQVLGLGAKNAGVVLKDAELDRTVSECVKGALSYNGQRCTALKALFVDKSIADDFAIRFAGEVSNLKSGMPWEQGVKITPLPEEGREKYFNELIEDAVAHGARVINRGGGESEGNLYTPAVLYPVTSKMRIYREEQFGPVVPIIPFDSEQEAVEFYQESDFGQQAAIFGRDPVPMLKLALPLSRLTARVNLNSQCQRGPDDFPFGGRKDSAVGTLSVRDALKIFSIESVIATPASDPMRKVLE